MCQSHRGMKYRSRSLDHSTCKVCTRTSRRSTKQGLVVIGLIVGEILNIDIKCVKVTAVNIGQGQGSRNPEKKLV